MGARGVVTPYVSGVKLFTNKPNTLRPCQGEDEDKMYVYLYGKLLAGSPQEIKMQGHKWRVEQGSGKAIRLTCQGSMSAVTPQMSPKRFQEMLVRQIP